MPQTPRQGDSDAQWIGQRFLSHVRKKKSFWIHYDDQKNLITKCQKNPVSCHGLVSFAQKISAKNFEAQTPYGTIRAERSGDVAELTIQGQSVKSKIGRMSDWFPSGEYSFIATRFDKNLLRIRIIVNQNFYHSPNLSFKFESPFIDYPGNNPPAPIYDSEDDLAFEQETILAVKSHSELALLLAKQLHTHTDLVLHSLYFPNIVFTRRWANPKVSLADIRNASSIPHQYMYIYKAMDQIVGEIIDTLPADAALVISSDHGIAPSNVNVSVNQILIDLDLLQLKEEQLLSKDSIDWEKSSAVFFKSASIYINPKISPTKKQEVIKKLVSSLSEIKWNDLHIFSDIVVTSDNERVDLVTNPGVHLVEDIFDNHKYAQSPSRVGGVKEGISSKENSLQSLLIIYEKSKHSKHSQEKISSHQQIEKVREEL